MVLALCCVVFIIIIIIIIMLTFIMRLLLQNKNIGAVQNTNSGRRNLLNVKSHIKKIGFELVLKNSTVRYGAQFCRKTVCLYVPRLITVTDTLQWRSCRAVRSVMDAALVLYQTSAAIENVQLVAMDAPSPRVGYVRLSANFILAAFVDHDTVNSFMCKILPQ